MAPAVGLLLRVNHINNEVTLRVVRHPNFGIVETRIATVHGVAVIPGITIVHPDIRAHSRAKTLVSPWVRFGSSVTKGAGGRAALLAPAHGVTIFEGGLDGLDMVFGGAEEFTQEIISFGLPVTVRGWQGLL